MTALLCDSGPLIATFNVRDVNHERCLRLLSGWQGRLLIPEPVLGETCNFSVTTFATVQRSRFSCSKP